MFRQSNLNLDLYFSFFLGQVGNQEFADYVDANLNVTHINNKSALFIFNFLISLGSNYSSDAL